MGGGSVPSISPGGCNPGLCLQSIGIDADTESYKVAEV